MININRVSGLFPNWIASVAASARDGWTLQLRIIYVVILRNGSKRDLIVLDWTIVASWAAVILESRWADAIYTFIIVFVVLVANAILKKLLGALTHKANSEGSGWHTVLLDAANAPVRGMVWIAGLTVAVRVLTHDGEYSLLSELFPPARDVAAIVLIGWFLIRIIQRTEKNFIARAHREGRSLDSTAVDAIGKLVRAAVFITTALLIMQALGFSIGGLVALGGVGGIAIGFAAQSLVANLVGGLTIYASRPFKVGEWIIMPGTEVMGEVQDIGWRATRVMGFDRRPFYVPNSMFNTAVVINHSRMTSRRIMEYIHVRLCDVDKVQLIVEDTNSMLAEHPGIEHDFFAFNFDTYGDSTLKLFLYAFTLSTDYNEFLNVKEDILVRIAELVHKHNGQLAAPTSTVHMPAGLQIKEPVLDGLVARPS